MEEEVIKRRSPVAHEGAVKLREGQPRDVDGEGLVEPHVGAGPEPEDDPDRDEDAGRRNGPVGGRPARCRSIQPGEDVRRRPMLGGVVDRMTRLGRPERGASTAVAGLSSTRSIGCRW